MILSDGFDKLGDLTASLRHLRHRHHEVLFLHILAPEEEEFPFRRSAGSATWRTPSQILRVNPSAVRKAYLEKFETFCRELKEAVRGMDADYHKVSTALTHERTLLDYLAARSGRGRGRGS